MKRNAEEYRFHETVSAYLDAVLPADAWWTTFPAGGGGKTRGAMLKRLGLKRGVPDLMLIFRSKVIFIELKAAGGVTSKAQKLTHREIQRAGAFTTVAYSIEAVQRCLDGFGIPTRGRIAA